MCPRSHTSGLISGLTGRCSWSSSRPSISAKVRSRTSSKVAARPRTAGVDDAEPEMRWILRERVAEEEEPVTLERPDELQRRRIRQELALEDAGLVAAAGEAGGEGEEELVHAALGHERGEHARPALAEHRGDAIAGARHL